MVERRDPMRCCLYLAGDHVEASSGSERIMWVQATGFTPQQLQRFRTLQRQVYATLIDVAGGLRTGITEKEATRALRRAFKRQGVQTYFHVPVALFGERSTYPG